MRRLIKTILFAVFIPLGFMPLEAVENGMTLCMVQNNVQGATVDNVQECNPFSMQKCLMFRLDQDAEISVRVVTPMGIFVKKLAGGRFEAGEHCLYWDCRDGDGNLVKGGIYVCEIVPSCSVFGENLAIMR